MGSFCSCSRFVRKIMNALNIDELEKNNPEASDIDLAFEEISRLQRVDKISNRLIDMLENIHDSMTEEDVDYKEIGDLIDRAKRVDDPDQVEREPIGALTPHGQRLDYWDERLRMTGCVPIYPEDDED